MIDQVGLDDRQRAHLLPYPLRAVPFRSGRPFHAAHLAVGTAGALQGGGCGGSLDLGHDQVVDEGGVFGGCDHPAREVGFEGEVVGVAGVGAFAGYFVHDVWGVAGEEDVRPVEDAGDAAFPEIGAVGLCGVSKS